MSRIHDALARARAVGPPEKAPWPDSGSGPTDWLAESPTEWIHEPTDQPRPATPASRRDSSQPTSGSNGHGAAKVWSFSPKFKEKLVLGDGADRAAIEQYRRLAAVLHLTQEERGPEKAKIVMISSSVSAEGKTLTCVNLALTLSESYHLKVLLVDGDLRRPWLHEVFQLPNVGGLNDSLHSPDARIPILQVSERLSVLTAGRPASDPMRVLSSERMEHVLQQARGQFDWVLLDTPPITLLSDASLLASEADLVILVIEAGKTGYEMAQRAADAVGRDRIVGVVLNRVESASHSVYTRSELEAVDSPS